MKNTWQRVLPALLVAALAGSAGAQNRPGSIYKPDSGPQGSIADKTARRPGDLLTVIIKEDSDIANEESSDLKKSTNLDYRLTNFDLQPDFFTTMPALAASSQDDMKGTANYKKKGSFEARLTAIVIDVLPNGNLVISGRREIRVDNETKLIDFSGIVRRFDVTAANTVTSQLVAEAKISYVGSGPLTKSTNRGAVGGFFHDLIGFLWPF